MRSTLLYSIGSFSRSSAARVNRVAFEPLSNINVAGLPSSCTSTSARFCST
jgi:hypothetical protein